MRIARITILSVLALATVGCDVPQPRSILAARCMTLRGKPVTVPIRAPAAGTLRIAIEPHGIAVVASIATASGLPARATSPVDRLGLITLLAPVRPGETVALRIESRDWHEIRADACVTADLLPRAAAGRTRAERAFASGGLATRAGDWQRAFDHYETAARAFVRLGLSELSGAAYHAMAELAIARLDRESDASAYARAALGTYGSSASSAVRGTLEAIEARAAVYTRNVAEATELRATRMLIDAARRRLADSPDGAREALRLTVLDGFLAYRADSPELAARLFARAIEDCRAAKDWECYGIAAQNTAVLAEARESFAVALDAYEDARRQLDPEIAPELTAGILDNVGRLQRAAGLVSESDASHAAALRLYIRLKDCDSVRLTLARIGALHAQVGSFDDAIVELRRAASLGCEELLGTFDADGDRSSPTDASSAPACVSVLEPKALSSDGRIAVLQAILALREASLLSGDLDTAQRCVAQAGRYADTSRGRVRVANARGELLLERGDSAAARSAFAEARSIADAARLSQTYEQRGRTVLGLARATLLAGDARDSLRWAFEALRAGSARADVRQTVDALRLLGEGFRKMREPELAARTLGVATGLIERVPIDELDGDVRATYLAAQHAAFAELTELLASAAPDEPAVWAAFSVAERGRARSFKYALSQTTKPGGTGSLDASAEARDEMLSRVSAVFQGDHGDDLADFVQRLDRLGAGTPGSFTARERSALQRRLASLDAVLVQYAAGPRGMFAFIVDGTRIRLARLGDREAIASAAARLAEQLRDREIPAGHVRASARELARRVWWPVAPFANAKRVLIAPDDTLHLVPFAVLPWSEASDDRLLVHRVEIATVPSALFVAGSSGGSRASTAARDLALVGDPVFRAAEWRRRCAGESAPTDSAAGSNAASRAWTEWMPSLPASRDEVLAIAALARKSPRRQVDTYLGCMATGDSVRRAARESHAVLHIATHGRIDARRPRLSALALTPDADGPEDATFGLLEILDLDLHARLVTLSACDTFGGRLLRGEGVLGPAQAFLQAGASSVVASHWRVEDETTARFMRALYGRLLDENMSIAEALRRTQLAEQTLGASYSWAAFALYGWPDTRI